jgi:hypothetical protein
VGEIGFFGFGLTVVSSTGIVPPGAAEIQVNPSADERLARLTFSSPQFNVPSGAAYQILIFYSVDPHPIIDGFDLEMFSFSPVFPGFAQVDTRLCLGQAYSPLCQTDVVLSVNHTGITSDLFDSASFPPQALIGVENKVTLDAQSGGSADFDSFSNTFHTIPEPSTWLLAVSAAAAMRVFRKRQRTAFNRRRSRNA